MSARKSSYVKLLKEAISDFDTSKSVDVKGPMVDSILSYKGDGELNTHKDAASILERYYFKEENSEEIEMPSIEDKDVIDEVPDEDIEKIKSNIEKAVTEQDKEISKQDLEKAVSDEDENKDDENTDIVNVENEIIEKLIEEMEEDEKEVDEKEVDKKEVDKKEVDKKEVDEKEVDEEGSPLGPIKPMDSEEDNEEKVIEEAFEIFMDQVETD